MDFLKDYSFASSSHELCDLSVGQEVPQVPPNSVIASDAILSTMLVEVYRSPDADPNALGTVSAHTLDGTESSKLPAAKGESSKKR
jgi:hypothetical protein